ncbi:flagellar biosynthesis anti-sigma factor FlgM [Clostridium sp.]|uniref:flagellar biosynthesis anti-sigma factor FlgM n=1 Tax=Clostridium sp. TaxID=1506 RepID=UPI0026289E1D|nr:flagellar biosynthesis anti-sigma factor FlgM [Clostridium sp.]
MKVSSIMANNMINAYSKQRQYVKSDTANKSIKDTVQISKSAKYLNEINNNEGIDLDKINEIKQRIKNGTYKIDSRSIAKSILNNNRGD